jgi:hypothetical protein
MEMNNFNRRLMADDDEREKSKAFKDELLKWNTLHGKENFKVPQIGGKELDLYKLFKEVVSRGGYNQVCDNKQWKEIVNSLDLPASCTSASFTLRNHYNKYLQAYENYYLKVQSNPSAAINFNFSSARENQNSSVSTNIAQPAPQQEQRFLGKKVMRNEGEFNLIFRYNAKQTTSNRDKTYQKKVRLLNAIPDMRRIVLAFESHITSEIIWSINILTLFSSNPNTNILIENQPYLMESLTNYMYYCVNNLTELYYIIDIIEGNYEKEKTNTSQRIFQSKRAKSYAEATTFTFLDEINNTLNLSTLAKKNKNLEEVESVKKENYINDKYEEVTEYELMEHLISIIQIIRNFSLIRANEPCIIKCSKFMNLIYLLFIHSNINEMRSNSLDIITNLSKHILLKETKYPIELMLTIYECLKSSNREMSEQALECFRRLTLPVGNETYFDKMPDKFYAELVNLLISYKVETRESALEILYIIADQKLPTKTKLGKQYKCISRLVALVCSNSQDNKISKFAACTLAKLSEVPANLKMIMPYEQELFVAACADESITKILLGIISN